MTKSDFEEILRDQGYKLDRRMGGDYWQKEGFPTYGVGRTSVKSTKGEQNRWYDLELEGVGVTGDNG